MKRLKNYLLNVDNATSFMIRDANMRKIVKRELTIPFTDRVRGLYTQKEGSTILIIGSSTEYLSYADTVILMDDYIAKNITDKIKTLNLAECRMEKRYLLPKQTYEPFIYFDYISNENTKKIILDEYSADITLLTALTSENQLNTLTYMMERFLTDQNSDRADLMEVIYKLSEACI